MVRCVCTSRNSVLCASALLLHDVLSYDTSYILGMLVIFFIRVFCRVLSSELVEQEQTKIQPQPMKNTPRDEQIFYLLYYSVNNLRRDETMTTTRQMSST